MVTSLERMGSRLQLRSEEKISFLRKIWRIIYKFYTISISLISIIFYLPIFPFLFLYSICIRGKGEGYCLGVVDTANNLFYFQEYLKKNNIPFSYNCRDSKIFYKKKIIEKVILYVGLLLDFLRDLRKRKIFFFCWTYSYMPFNLDFIFLRIAGKKVLRIHCGDDVRYRPLHNRLFNTDMFKFPINPFDTSYLGFIRKFYRQKWPLVWRVCILSCRETETFLNSSGCYQAFLTQEDTKDKIIKDYSSPLIIHAPSERSFKGTSIVLEALKILEKEKIKFRFKLLEGVTNEKVLRVLEEALIVLDQPGFAAGRLAAEALSRRCIVFCNDISEYTGFSRKLPLENFPSNPHNLADGLKKVLGLSKEEILKKQDMAYQAWIKHYSFEATQERIKCILQGDSKYKLYPSKNHKEKLLMAAENTLQRFIIKLFVK